MFVEHPNTYARRWNNYNGIFLCDKTVALLKNKKARWDLDQQTNLINGFWVENDDLEKIRIGIIKFLLYIRILIYINYGMGSSRTDNNKNIKT